MCIYYVFVTKMKVSLYQLVFSEVDIRVTWYFVTKLDINFLKILVQITGIVKYIRT